MRSLIVENVRCFHTLQTAPLAPLTFLVGENSSGKSTFLALVRVAWEVASGGGSVDFNEEPFLLGAFDQIATYRGGRGGRAKSFSVGFLVEGELDDEERTISSPIQVVGTFESHNGQPRMSKWKLSAIGYEIEIIPATGQQPAMLAVATPAGRVKSAHAARFFGSRGIPLYEYLEFVIRETFLERQDGDPQPQITEEDLGVYERMLNTLRRSIGTRPYAFAPIRTRPRRTYDPLKDTPEPEGSHVPLALARMYSTAPEQWKQLRRQMEGFGTTAALFRRVDVRRMGQKDSDPFQLRVKIEGPAFNLVDVGYGVSQVLPIVVDSVSIDEHRTLLLQQPEVHLHPRAQAALGTFLGALVRSQRKRVIVETHSDFLLDRVRMDVRDGKVLGPDDVSILYFERRQGKVKIHPIKIDAAGNVVGAPRSYRRFFLEEERRHLGA
ncbi:MAG TPA: AAA family ATPase [Candidatus Polarisedimenticolia bacterium]|nr:AAA family ATPase [Candidatus Polarisedimenticolia bacterium]